MIYTYSEDIFRSSSYVCSDKFTNIVSTQVIIWFLPQTPLYEKKIILVQWCLRQEPDNNLCGYYVCEFITAHIRRTPEDVLRVRIYQYLFIFKRIYIHICVLILFLLFQMQDWMVETKGHAKRPSESSSRVNSRISSRKSAKSQRRVLLWS